MPDRQIQQLYWIWSSMRQRCQNPNNKGYQNYGGRGIKVATRWEKFEQFKNDMGLKPYGMTIERIDNNGPYSPDNCKWASRTDQARNRRFCNLIELDGNIVSLKEYCRAKDIRYRPTAKRISRGWTIQEAVSIPLGIGKGAIHKIRSSELDRV